MPNTSPKLSRRNSLIIDESQYALVDALSQAQNAITIILHETQILIRSREIEREAPNYSIQQSFRLCETQLRQIYDDDCLTIMLQDQEPSQPLIDQWRRSNAALSTNIHHRPTVIVPHYQMTIYEHHKPEWEPFEPQMVLTGTLEVEEDRYDQSLRTQLEYREKLKVEFEANQKLQEHERQEERRKIRVLVDGQPERVTYDIDGKIILKHSKVSLPKLNNQIKGHEYVPPPPPDLNPEKPIQKIPKMKYKHKVYRLLPKLDEDPEARKIIAQQEHNIGQELLESINVSPGVHIQFGNLEKGMRHSETQAQKLPYRIQSSMGEFLSQEASQSIRLTKEEYSSVTLNGSIIIKQGSYEQSYLNRKSNKTNKSLKSQSIIEDPIPKEGIVKVNDIGKFYELLIKDQETLLDSESKKEEPLEQTFQTQSFDNQKSTRQNQSQIISHQLQQKAQMLQHHNQPSSDKSRAKTISNSTSQPELLPSIPATQFYRYLQNQHQSSTRLDNSSMTGSITSKLTRERSMPEAITNLKMHRFLAAPKIGKYLGFGVGAKYKF